MAQKRKKSDGSKRQAIVMILLRNGVAMAILGLIGAVAAHFVLQGLTRHSIYCEVPQFEGLTVAEAERVAADNELHIIVNDSLYAPNHQRGAILYQLPEEGTIVKPKRTIYVTINATQQKMVDVPYVAGRSLRQAKNMLEVAGLQIERLVYREDLATNYILTQLYRGQQITQSSHIKAAVGSGVTLEVGVGAGRESVVVPQLFGRSLVVAKSVLLESGLNIGEIIYDEDIDSTNEKLARVYAQSIEGETEAVLGDEVALSVTISDRKVDSITRSVAEQKRWEEEMLRFEEASLDSLNLIFVDTMEVVKPERKAVERVDIGDLFN